MIGNQDKERSHPFDERLAQPGYVVAFQQFVIEKPGSEPALQPHPTPIQSYPLKRFQDQYAVPPGQKNNGFFQLGLLVTPLHVPEEGLEPDEDFDLPEGPIADTAPGTKAETIKEVVEAINNGTGLANAELEFHRGRVRELEAQAASSGEENAGDKIAEQTEDGKKLGDAATAESVAKAAEHAQATGDAPVVSTTPATPAKGLSAAQKAKADKAEREAAAAKK